MQNIRRNWARGVARGPLMRRSLSRSASRAYEMAESPSASISPDKTTSEMARLSKKQWKQAVKDIRDSRFGKTYSQGVEVATEAAQRANLSALPKVYLEETMALLSEYHPTKEHAELMGVLFDAYVANGYAEQVPDTKGLLNLVKGLYNCVVDHADPVLVYKYKTLTQRINLPSYAIELYRNLLSLFMASGDLEGAITVLQEATELGYAVPYHTQEALLISLLDCGEIEVSWNIMYALHSSGRVFSRTWGLFINSAIRAYHYPALDWAFKNAIIPGSVVLDDWSFEQMAEIASRNGDHAMVRWALLRAKNRHEAIRSIHRHSLRSEHHNVTNATNATNLTKAGTTNASNTSIGQGIFDIDARYFESKRGKKKDCSSELMDGNDASASSFVPLIEAHAKAQELAPALDILERLRENASDISISQLPELIALISKHRSTLEKTTVRLTDLSKDPHIPSSTKTLLFNIIIAAIARLDAFAAVQFYKQSLIALELWPNEDTITFLVSISASKKDPLLTDELLDDSAKFDIALSHKILASAVLGYLDQNLPDTARVYYNSMLDNNIQPKQFISDLLAI
ncbi:hypothetical protein TRVA0_019S01552 [Trichomonascus vanleenenianus]|uniref:uncharacterized protein n=1 Tax=Trichomonascus vanleenenianus TaxID=2268995 RepID=UPI003ECA121C